MSQSANCSAILHLSQLRPIAGRGRRLIRGKLMRRGDTVLVSLASINQDEGIVAHAGELDITRQEDSHLAFGKGHHHCLSAPLARLGGQIAISTLLHCLPSIQLNIDQVALA